MTRSDLLIVDEIDLAPYVGADLGVMERDARAQRGEMPQVFTDLEAGRGGGTVRDRLAGARRAVSLRRRCGVGATQQAELGSAAASAGREGCYG
ncbi:MAG: hypothetical protein U5J97_01920 [Trueperaceae bacterium]|nr:hypothetical protein [Trueperaceae bacterium]